VSPAVRGAIDKRLPSGPWISSDGTVAECCGNAVLGSIVGCTYQQWAAWRVDRNQGSPGNLEMDAEQVL
jgi:hypothetical protein